MVPLPFTGGPSRGSMDKGLGKEAEELAVRFLSGSKGYRILERNYRCPFGEVDIIAFDKGVLAFVEVKGRSSLRYGYPSEAVNSRKRQKILRAASYYLQKKGLEGKVPVRFDVVCLLFREGKAAFELIKGAFSAGEE